MSNRHTKRDATQRPIVAAFKRIGWWYRDCASYRGLGFDILTKHRDGFPVLLEIKAEGPKSVRHDLTQSELDAKLAFPHFWRVVQTVDEALAAVGLGT